ncbi:MAG: enoyl-CoA hydratase/isomerase family protein [Burkholderiaceae bacterium]|nr:enoyl-CoA hydratase/isomerase family protein [Burkholderiaceae bacterium]
MPETTAAPLVLVERQGSIAHIIMNRPASRNSADLPMAQALRDAVTEVCYDPAVHVVVLRSSSAHFMAGGDVRRFGVLLEGADRGQGELEAIITAVNQITLGLTRSPCMVIGLLSGSVAGVGCSLAMACDIVIAADDTRFVMAYNGLGATPDGGATWLLPRLVGLQRALAIALLNQSLDASQAHAAGLVTQVVPLSELDACGDDMARRLAAGPVQAQARTKALLRGALDSDLETALGQEKAAFLAQATTPDFTEGVQAFVQRRVPQFGDRP